MAGTPQGMQTSNLYKNMMNNPLYQQRMQDAKSAEGRDNKAVSQMDRMVGADMASEQNRLLGLDRAGREIARRSDKLEFARKNFEFEKTQASRNLQNQNQRLSLQRQQMDQADTFGLEFGLGLLSTGVNAYGGMKATDNHKEYMKSMRQMSTMFYSHMSNSDDWYGNPEE